MKTNYTDTNGNVINYGDILKWVHYPQRTEEERKYAPKEPYLKIVKLDNKDMMYMSGVDEYTEIKDWQTKEDIQENKISSVEIKLQKVKEE